MNNLKVLHITPWFPNEDNPTEGIFVWEHIKSLNPHVSNEIINLRFSKRKKVQELDYNGTKLTDTQLKTPIDKWIIKERITRKKVNKIISKCHKDFDIVNFHIAYPNAISIGKLKQAYPLLKFVITEHWTAYHYNFHLPEGNKGRKRMEQIFHHNIPVITVSNALAKDIQSFSRTTNFKSYIVPNVLRTDIFNYRTKEKKDVFTFSSINNWNSMKNPITLIRAFHKIATTRSNVQLILGGHGTLIPEMKALVENLGINEKVQFVGRLTKEEVASVLFKSDVYVQCSNYETFSVISAEALATGTPVITTNIGGVLDFINSNNGILVNGMEVDTWAHSLQLSIDKYEKYNLSDISKNAIDQFNIEAVGKKYADVLKAIANEK